MKTLLKSGVEINDYDTGGKTALFYAKRSKNRTIISALEEYGAKVENVKNKKPDENSLEQRVAKNAAKSVYQLKSRIKIQISTNKIMKVVIYYHSVLEKQGDLRNSLVLLGVALLRDV